MEQVLRRYPSAQVVIAGGAYDKEGLLEWLVERGFTWVLGYRRLSRCYDELCVVEACWIEWACVRWLVRRMAEKEKCYTVSNKCLCLEI